MFEGVLGRRELLVRVALNTAKVGLAVLGVGSISGCDVRRAAYDLLSRPTPQSLALAVEDEKESDLNILREEIGNKPLTPEQAEVIRSLLIESYMATGYSATTALGLMSRVMVIPESGSGDSDVLVTKEGQVKIYLDRTNDPELVNEHPSNQKRWQFYSLDEAACTRAVPFTNFTSAFLRGVIRAEATYKPFTSLEPDVLNTITVLCREGLLREEPNFCLDIDLSQKQGLELHLVTSEPEPKKMVVKTISDLTISYLAAKVAFANKIPYSEKGAHSQSELKDFKYFILDKVGIQSEAFLFTYIKNSDIKSFILHLGRSFSPESPEYFQMQAGTLNYLTYNISPASQIPLVCA